MGKGEYYAMIGILDHKGSIVDKYYPYESTGDWGCSYVRSRAREKGFGVRKVAIDVCHFDYGCDDDFWPVATIIGITGEQRAKIVKILASEF